MYDPLGLSIGATNLVAACNGKTPVTRRTVLTLYPHCAPKVGTPEQDPELTEPGVLMGGFVERLGDRVPLVSPDGSTHDPALLMVEALDAMVSAVDVDASSAEISIAVPAYWNARTAQALRNGLRTHVGFVRSGMAPRLVPDTVAALTAANSELGMPDGKAVALLDFGGSGTYVTLLETESEFTPISATMRYEDFSGAEIDQALLQHVIDELGHDDIDPDDTAAVAQLGLLREQCRAAKERLSVDTTTQLLAELRGSSAIIELSRSKLEDLFHDRLTGFIYAFDDMLARSNSTWTDLAALVTVGGGASIPLITERLSVHTRLPVLTPAEPACAAATGALLLSTRGKEVDFRTRMSLGLVSAHAGSHAGTGLIELPAGDVMVIDCDAMTDRELAWSQTEFTGDLPVRFHGDAFNEEGPCWSMRLNVIDRPKEPPWRRFRVSQLLIGLCAAVAVTAIGGVAVTLTTTEQHHSPRHHPVVPSVAPRPSGSVAPNAIPPSAIPPSAVPPSVPSELPPPVAESIAPPPSALPEPTSVPPPPPSPPPPSSPPPPVLTTTTAPPLPTTTTTPPPVATTPAPTITTPATTEPPGAGQFAAEAPSAQEPAPPPPPTSAPSTVQMTTQWLHVPLLPVPIPVPVPKPPQPQPPQEVSPQNPFAAPGSH
ncbi:Hsp70 family protein [Mycobacterium bourgelatii]|uniref:Molecular chaperone n=1 Tax=Mycobacterium bourgelatii TaxID=1273442 RepID=A0A7I9YHD7_MYCBU|nr:Hsp70 family protein [Mycobacterium bourgelatii]MCV6976773.1 Hsp70 family protein [Mycobacterium bourgelatii]GFG88064.1 hypothetical protein MBOU_01060 [Mycobacterium bourgelatii]